MHLDQAKGRRPRDGAVAAAAASTDAGSSFDRWVADLRHSPRGQTACQGVAIPKEIGLTGVPVTQVENASVRGLRGGIPGGRVRWLPDEPRWPWRSAWNAGRREPRRHGAICNKRRPPWRPMLYRRPTSGCGRSAGCTTWDDSRAFAAIGANGTTPVTTPSPAGALIMR